jgi:predicted TIM-barrel fold metal-dependent hydrolase
VVDADAHVNEDLLGWKRLHSEFPGWLGAGVSGGTTVAQIDGKLFPLQEGRGRGVPVATAISPAAEAGARDVGQRLADLDTEGIDTQVLYGGLALGVSALDDAGLARAIAETYNDWLLDDVCGADPARLKAAAVVALQDPSRAAAEIARAVGRGAVAVTVPPVVGGAEPAGDGNTHTLDHPSLLPVFEAAAAAGVPVAIHSAPGMNIPLPAAGLFDNYAQVHALSFPVDQMVAFTALAMGGVLDRVPELRVVFLEAGVGWVPWFLHRVEEHREKRGDMVPGMKVDPIEYVERGQCWFSFEPDEPFLAEVIARIGHRSLVWSSDYPHWDCDFPGTVTETRTRATAGLADEVVADLMGLNAARLYNL